MPAGTSQDATVKEATALEQVVRDTVPVELLQTQVGGSGLQAAFTGATNSKANMTVRLDPDVNLQDALAKLRTTLGSAAGDAQITVSDQSAGFGGGNAIEVLVQGEDYAKVSDTAKAITDQVAKVKDLANVENDVVDAKPEIVVTVDPAKALAAGSTTADIAAQVRAALTGTPAGQVVIDGAPYPATLVITGAATDVNALRQLPVGKGTTVPLGQVANVEQGTGPTQIVRVDGDRAATVSGTITSDKTGGVIADVTKIVNDYDAPEGVEVSMGGVSQDQGEAFASMGVALLIAIALVYLAMVVSFGSLSTPFVILFSLPLAVIGVMVALFVSGKSIGLPALIGVLMLIGIVVTNAIVLLEYVIELRKRGLPLVEALVEGGKTRLRPILMTAIATILALIPLALSKNSGAIIASDLAVVVIGGLITSTVLTLVVVPVIFELIGGRQERREARRAAKEAARAATTAPVATATGGER
jgi:HAE1 family hydrophobic/amphiphilic exporter-1